MSQAYKIIFQQSSKVTHTFLQTEEQLQKKQ